jgi:phage I-like protein
MSKPISTVIAAQDLAGQAPARIQLLPKQAATGETWHGRNGNGPYVVPDLQAVIAASDLPLYIDYDHLSDLEAGLGTEKKAAGWINKLEADAEGLWGIVEWTKRATAAIGDKEYRFISPAFHVAKDTGQVQCLIGAGLTNKPNFIMKALASESGAGDSDPTRKPQKDVPMNSTHLAALCAALAIAVDSDASQIVTAAQGLRSQVDLMGKQLNLTGKSVLEIASAAATELGRLDRAAFVPKADHEKVTAELASLQTKVKDGDAVAAVEAEMRAGKVTPGMKDWALAEAKRDLASFQGWAKVAPVVIEPGSVQAEIAAAAEGSNKVANGITPPAGFTMNPDRVALHNKALAHKAKNPTLTYEQSLVAVGG